MSKEPVPLSPLGLALLRRASGDRRALGDALDTHMRGSVNNAETEVVGAGLMTRSFQLTKAGRELLARVEGEKSEGAK